MSSRRRWVGAGFVAVCAALVVPAAPARAAWVWTPESGRWVNPANQPKESASLQFQYAEEQLEKKEYDEAIREFERLQTHFPASAYGDLAQFSIGRAHEGAGRWADAALAYQKTIDDFPDTRLFDRVITKQYELGNKYYERAVAKANKRSLLPNLGELFSDKNDFDRAIEVYQRVVENQPFTDAAAEAQYRIGLCYSKQEEYELAIDEYETVLELYPSSPWAGEAAFSAAEAQFLRGRPADYDQTAVEDSIERLEDYLRHYNNASRRADVERMLLALDNSRAEHEFRIAEWYHRNLKYQAARLYYAQVITAHPDTEWATKSRQELEQLP